MARFSGNLGYARTVQTRPGVWEEQYTVRKVRGDIRRYAQNFDQGSEVNGRIKASHQISVLADPYMFQHFMDIRWIEWAGRKYEITYVEVERPRITLTIGGPYNAVDG